MEEELSTRAELKHEVQLALGLKCKRQLDYEWVLHIFKDGSLSNGVLDLVLLDKVLLLKGLDCIDILCVDLFGQEYLSVRACSDHLHQLEVIY